MDSIPATAVWAAIEAPRLFLPIVQVSAPKSSMAVMKPVRLYSRRISASRGPSLMASPSVASNTIRSMGKLLARAAASVVRMQTSGL